jgi:hypothetical protein
MSAAARLLTTLRLHSAQQDEGLFSNIATQMTYEVLDAYRSRIPIIYLVVFLAGKGVASLRSYTPLDDLSQTPHCHLVLTG